MYDLESARADGVTQLGHPSLIWGLAEALRFPTEFVSSYAWEALVPAARADRARTVLVLPGFMATDAMTGQLRRSLGRDGHRVHPAGLGRMVGLTDAVLDGALIRVEELAHREGPVTVVGWSFGGVLARWLAHERPTLVEHVVTVGSPWRAEGEVTRATTMFQASARRHGISERAVEVIGTVRTPLPCPLTAIYSTTDGLVPWRACTAEEGPTCENVPVPSSHVGLMHNPLVLTAVRDRVAQDPPLARRFSWRDALVRPWQHTTEPAHPGETR